MKGFALPRSIRPARHPEAAASESGTVGLTRSGTASSGTASSGTTSADPTNARRPALLDPKRAPPDDYYAGNLLTVVRTVHAQYDTTLTDEERAFGHAVVGLSTAALRLFARLVGRKGPCIRIDTLDYQEVPGTESALGELSRAGLVGRCEHSSDVPMLAKLTRAELGEVFPEVARTGNKTDYLERILCTADPEAIQDRIAMRVPWVQLTSPYELGLYCLLFFGDAYQDMTTFVMRDLGLRVCESVAIEPSRRLFRDRESLDRYLQLLEVGEALSEVGPRPDAAVVPLLQAWTCELWATQTHRFIERRRSRLLNEMGRRLERVGEFDLALETYARSTLAPARERRTRILKRLGDRVAVERLRAAIARAPQNALERQFADNFGRPGRRCDDAFRFDVELPGIDAIKSPAVEAYAREHLVEARGGDGWHLENQLPRALFALAYWDWIFAPVPGAFVNPFQAAPMDLFWSDFFETRMGTCVDPLDNASPLHEKMIRVHKAKCGTWCRLINWEAMSLDRLTLILETIPEADLRKILSIVRQDLAQARTGFPDLTMVYGPGDYEFVEVKGPGDQLQKHQRIWIDKLCEFELPVRLMRFTCPKEPERDAG